MKRRALRWAVVLVALLSVVSLIDSYFHDFCLYWRIDPMTHFGVIRYPGKVVVEYIFGMGPGPQPFYFSYHAPQGAHSSQAYGPRWLSIPGLAIYIDSNRGGLGVDALVVSHALLTGVLVALAGLTWRLTRTRRKPHQCPSCGYDLRGSAGDARCPECGAAKGGEPRGEAST